MCGDIRKSRCTTGVNNTGGQCQQHQWQIATGINDTGEKFVTSVNDTSGK
jgi:hypothetical protein